MFSQLRKHGTVGSLTVVALMTIDGCGFYEFCKSSEYVFNLARVFEPVAGIPPFGLVSHDFCNSQGAENIAGARYAAANGFRDLTGAHLFIFSEQGDHREGNGISKEPA